MTLEDLETQLLPIRVELKKYEQTVPTEYFRGCMFIALNYAQNGFCEEALSEILRVPRSYIQGTFQSQMETSELFFITMSKLFGFLEKAGLDPDALKGFIQQPGKA